LHEPKIRSKRKRILNLVAKGLIELSPRIGELTFLKHFYFAQNSLSTLPMALADLEELDLGNNLGQARCLTLR
jgi:Leucine-rich repeat (LRR) protein